MKICGCGARLERRPKETAKQFEARQYCNVQCAGKYRPSKPVARGFGMEVPAIKRTRIRKGYRAYLGEG